MIYIKRFFINFIHHVFLSVVIAAIIFLSMCTMMALIASIEKFGFLASLPIVVLIICSILAVIDTKYDLKGRYK